RVGLDFSSVDLAVLATAVNGIIGDRGLGVEVWEVLAVPDFGLRFVFRSSLDLLLEMKLKLHFLRGSSPGGISLEAEPGRKLWGSGRATSVSLMSGREEASGRE